MHRPNPLVRWMILASTVAVVATACGGTTATGTASASLTVVAPSATGAPAVVRPVAPSARPVALTLCPIRTVTWDGTSPLDLTGVWSVDGHGMYYITQIGNAIWWIGLSGLGEPIVDSGREWANAFEGEIKGSTVTGTYVDVPKGDSDLHGPVKLEIRRTASGSATLVRTNPDSETEFGGKVFTPCRPG